MAYVPKPAGPKNLREFFHYLWRELSTIGTDIGDEGSTPDPDPDPTPVPPPAPGHIHYHDNLYGRYQPDQHPMSSIIGLEVAIDAQTRTFFQDTEPSDANAGQGDIWFVSGYE
jgi:hypothetical protein